MGRNNVLDEALAAVDRAMDSVPSNSSYAGRIESLKYAKELIADLKKPTPPSNETLGDHS
jgi:hypothetical protein